MTGFKKIYSVFERKPPGSTSNAGGHRFRVKRSRQNQKLKRGALLSERNDLVHLFQPLGIEAEFLGHLDQLLRGFRILDGFGELPGSVGLIAVVVGLGHRSTFLDKYGLRQIGSTSGTRPDIAG
jgi:hypothetical protein